MVKTKVPSQPTFFAGETRLYQLGQYFSDTHPSGFDHSSVQSAYKRFQRTRKSQSMCNKNINNCWFLPEPIQKSHFHESKYRGLEIEAALGYPLSWIKQSNNPEYQKDHDNAKLLDLEFFQNKYIKDDLDESNYERNKRLCRAKGELLFNHQKFVKYTLRPYSPVRSLIVNSRTGSGKTRMMQVVLENFGCFPNLKIVLFPTPVLREAFYNEYVSKYSKYYDIDTEIQVDKKAVKGIKREIRRRSDGISYEVLDSFNVKYGTNKDCDEECTVRGKYDNPLFEDYHMMVEEGKSKGVTLVLTYRQFYDMCKDRNTKGSDCLYRNGYFDLSGATVLVDEAHLLVSDYEGITGTMMKEIKETLEKHAKNLYTIGLFTATPFEILEHITKYKKLLHAKYSNPEKIALNHMMYYSNGKSEYMFNGENIQFVDVEPSQIIKRRSDTIGLPVNYQRLGKHCWFTQLDITMVAEMFDMELKSHNFELPTQSVEPILKSDMTITEQYDSIMKQDYTTDSKLNILKRLYPKLGYTFEKIYDQYVKRRNRIEFWEHALDRISKGEFNPEFKKDLVRKATQLDLLKKDEDVDKIDEIPSNSVGFGDDEEEGWKESIGHFLKEAYEDRIVVMIDFEYGIIELSKILLHHRVPHVILQIEISGIDSTGEHKQLQLCGEDLENDVNIKRAVIGSRFKDDDLIKYVNSRDGVENAPVILFNSYIPEGVSLYSARRLHVITMDESYTNISQMIGRINRLCHTTSKDKEIYMYVYTDSQEKSEYQQVVNERNGWPYLNKET